MTELQQQEIFNNWLGQYKALFFKVIRAYAFTPMDRDDLFQEIIIQVWHSVPSFKHQSSASTWLYRISFNTALKWSQREQRSRPLRDPIDHAQHVLEEAVDKDERVTWLYEAIAKFDPIDRSVCLLLLDGLSYKEMSAIVGISESNVGVKINRIKKKLILSLSSN